MFIFTIPSGGVNHLGTWKLTIVLLTLWAIWSARRKATDGSIFRTLLLCFSYWFCFQAFVRITPDNLQQRWAAPMSSSSEGTSDNLQQRVWPNNPRLNSFSQSTPTSYARDLYSIRL
jgi:hypothetical protein